MLNVTMSATAMLWKAFVHKLQAISEICNNMLSMGQDIVCNDYQSPTEFC